MVCIDTPPHFATPDQPWMQKCWVICSWRQRPQVGQGELDGVLDEAVDPQPVVGEVPVEQGGVLRRVGVLAVVPEVGRDVFSPYSPGVASSCSKSRCTGPISAKPTRCTTRGWRNVNGVAATQPTTTTTIEAAKTAKPTQSVASRPA